MTITLRGLWSRPKHAEAELARLDNPETVPMVYVHGEDDEVLERIADCERKDGVLLRMVLSCTAATAVLGIAGGLLG